MLLPSRLSSTTLGDLLGTLHRADTTGVLEIVEVAVTAGRGVPGRSHRIHFVAGLVAAVETELSVEPLGEVLRRRGLVDRAALERLAVELARGDARPAGAILIGLGVADADAIAYGLTEQTRE